MKKFYLFILLATLVALAACEDESGKEIYNDTKGEEYRLGDYYVDDLGNEGIVVYYNKYTPKIIMVMSLDEACLPWGPMDHAIFQSDSVKARTLDNPSFGLSVLQSMQESGIEHYPAMAWCDKKNGGARWAGAGSWRLPTRYELSLVFGQETVGGRSSVSGWNEILASVDGMSLGANHYYWTCQEDLVDNRLSDGSSADGYGYDRKNRAIPVNVYGESPADKDLWLKKNSYYVRAIKYIYFYNF